MKKRFLILALCLLLAVSLAVSAGAAEPEGSFVLTACTANSMVIRPERVTYTPGQTIKEALLQSGHEFTGLEERNFIDAIDGVVANYIMFYDGGGWNLELPASSITAIRIGVTSVPAANQADMLSLIRAMAAYSDMENHVQNYPNAQEAYKLCLNGVRGNGSTATILETNLANAIAEYQAILDGPKYTVTVTALQGEDTVPDPHITMTDEYENVTTAVGNTIDVIAGNYTFSVSDGGYNRTEGTLTVDGNAGFTTNLPTGEWFEDIYMRRFFWAKLDYEEPYRSTRDDSTHRITFWIPDIAEGYYDFNLVTMIGNVPNRDTTALRTIYTSVDGRDFSTTTRSWQDETVGYGNFLDSLVGTGMEGRSFRIEGQYPDENGHTQIQSFFVEVIRYPTLESLEVFGEGTKLSLGNEVYDQYGDLLPTDLYLSTSMMDLYTTAITDSLEFFATPFCAEYSVQGTGVVLVPSGVSMHYVIVTAPNGTSSTYSIEITKSDAVQVELIVPENTTAILKNQFEGEIIPINGLYHLLPGETYTYFATKDTFYHTSASFVASDGLMVSVAEPIIENWLTGVALFSSVQATDMYRLPFNEQFTAGIHSYSCTISDCVSLLTMQATTTRGDAYAVFEQQTGSQPNPWKRILITSQIGWAGGQNLQYCGSKGGFKNDLSVSVEDTVDGITYSQIYELFINKQLSIYDLSVSIDGESCVLLDESGSPVEFDRDILTYSILVNRDSQSLTINGEYPCGGQLYAPKEQFIGGYHAVINGAPNEEVVVQVPRKGTHVYLTGETVELDTEKSVETVEIRVCHRDESAVEAIYTLNLIKTDPVVVTLQADPADMLVCLINDETGKRIFGENGVYLLTPGKSYTYTATCAGYVGVKAQYVAPDVDSTWSITLERAPANTSLINYPSQWPHLRQNNDNNGVINIPTPTSCDSAVLYWASKLGSSYEDAAVSPPILVNRYLYVYSGLSIFKIDAQTGETLASAPMENASSFAINPPTYADGMIFVGQRNGTIQAFNAKTLESLWVYHDALGGQPNCPIVYHNGYIFTGFWLGETTYANYVCISATDEDPTQTNEEKYASWTYTFKGGFYWSGAYVCDDYVLVGTDDGEITYSFGNPHLISLDTHSGKIISDLTLPVLGDMRSSITHYDGKFYFTNKGGYFFEATVGDDGIIQAVRIIDLGGMSTSTPVIYNGRAYVGVSGLGQFNSYSGHSITVIDIPNWEIAYQAETKGYPQSSGVLTTAYNQETGCVYVYFTENMTPGILRVLEDKPGQVVPSMTTVEEGHITAYNLFQPEGEHAQYVLCSPIVDENGTIYLKNDSGYLMAVGSAITELEVTGVPDDLTYHVGDVFDLGDMRVIAHFANGTSRDVTEYITYSKEPLTAEDADFQLLYPIVMYQNVIEYNMVLAGIEVTPPIAVLSLTIETDEPQPEVKYGDVNGDGRISSKDLNLVFKYYSGNTGVELNEAQRIVADVNGDGRISGKDYNFIFKYIAGIIDHFPVEK